MRSLCIRAPALEINSYSYIIIFSLFAIIISASVYFFCFSSPSVSGKCDLFLC